MANAPKTIRYRFWLCLIRLIGVLVPRRLRADWRQEWEAELRYRELLVALNNAAENRTFPAFLLPELQRPA